MYKAAEQGDTRIRRILIVGGGTAGWMTAATLANLFAPEDCRIDLVESDQIGTVGVGEATIPNMRGFNEQLGIDENDFLSKTQGTFKLGIQFVNWGKLNHSYFHHFGTLGTTMGSLMFYNYWLKYHKAGQSADPGEFSIAQQAALLNRFMPAQNIPNSPLSDIGYAYHFDAGLYAHYLRNYAEQRGVTRHEGEVVKVDLRPDDGFIEAVQLQSREKLTADLFIDCTGFRGLLIEQTLNTGFDDWSDMLPCDSAVTVPSSNVGDLPPYTRSTAHTAGWQWKIPLQHRTGNGHVYSRKYMSDDEAQSILLNNIEGEALAEPRIIRFKTGKRKKFWNRNCVAIGLSSGFLEPLESTSIYLIQSSILKLISLFPSKAFAQTEIDRYNRMLGDELSAIRDFVILHYKLNERTDSPFWNYCRAIEPSEHLREKLEGYCASGRIQRWELSLFKEESWVVVMHGQGLVARDYHPVVDLFDESNFQQLMPKIRRVIKESAEIMPTHREYIAKYCAAIG